MLKLGCTLPNLANICVHKPTDAKFYTFTDGDENLSWKKIEKMLLVVHPSFSHAKQLMMKLLFEKLQTCKFIAGIDASQLYPYSTCESILTGLYTQWDLHPETFKFRRQESQSRSLKIRSSPIFNEREQTAKSEASMQQADRKKLTAWVLIEFVLIATQCSKPRVVTFITFVPVKKGDRLSLKRIFNAAVRRKCSMNWHEAIYRKRVSLLMKYGSLSCGDFTRQPITVNNIRENFPRTCLVTTEQLLEEVKKRELFGYVQCETKLPEH